MKTLDPEALRAARAEARRLRERRELRRALLKHGLLILASFGMLYPLFWMVASSFKPESEIFSDPGLWPNRFEFGNYAGGWYALRESFTGFFTNSILIAALSVIGNVMACSL